MGEGDGDGESDGGVVLTVPAEPDFVTLVRLAARILAGRAGQDDDSRTQLQARVGAAFLAVTEVAGPASEVAVHLRSSAGAVAIDLLVDAQVGELAAARLDDAGLVHAPSEDGRTLHVTITA